MDGFGIIILLYAFGFVFLVADIFLPSHLTLSALGLISLTAAVVLSFRQSAVVGWTGLSGCTLLLPTMAYFTVKHWHRTPIGRRTAPANPILTQAHIGVPLETLEPLLGRFGTSVSTLRPVGVCDFNGRRVSCIVDVGMIETGRKVQAIGISGSNVLVADAHET